MGRKKAWERKMDFVILIPLTLFFSYSIDFWMWTLKGFNPSSYYMKALSVLLGSMVLAAGISGEVKADVTMMSGEYLVREIATKTKIRFGWVKLTLDILYVVLSVVLSLALGGKVEGIREGTLVAALIVGPLTNIMTPSLGFMDSFLGASRRNEGRDTHSHSASDTSMVVTFTRDFGSGARILAPMVAKNLGYTLIDKNTIQGAAVGMGVSFDEVERYDESSPYEDLLDLVLGDYEAPVEDSLSPIDRVFVAQSRAIRALSAKGDCVILGRCSDCILDDHPKDRIVRVFCYTTMQDAARRCRESYGMREEDIEKEILSQNRRRIAHYRHFTHRKWKDPSRYDIMVNTSSVSMEEACRVVCEIVRKKASARS